MASESKDRPRRKLPEGFLEMEVIKGRHDPSVHERSLPERKDVREDDGSDRNPSEQDA